MHEISLLEPEIGKEHKVKAHSILVGGLSVFHFHFLSVFLIGENGTIDGQGGVWWNMWRTRTLKFTRPSLVELMNSRGILISNVVFKNSPFWNIHPVYST